MKKIAITSIAAVALIATLGGCSKEKELNQANVSKAMQSYLAQRGDLCLAKSVWPIDVTAAETGSGSRNGVQMPVLEKLGLVSASDAIAERKDDDGNVSQVPVRRYQLTDEGKKYYLPRAPHKHQVDDHYAAVANDFCAAKLSLDHVVERQLGGAEVVGDGGVVVARPRGRLGAGPASGRDHDRRGRRHLYLSGGAGALGQGRQRRPRVPDAGHRPQGRRRDAAERSLRAHGQGLGSQGPVTFL